MKALRIVRLFCLFGYVELRIPIGLEKVAHFHELADKLEVAFVSSWMSMWFGRIGLAVWVVKLNTLWFL